jgi:lysophospholipase L1-like esterase
VKALKSRALKSRPLKRRLALALALSAALCLTGPAAAAPEACKGGLCEGRALVPFLRVLRTARSRPVHILQIGDSHTANDNFAGAWRDILQARYGDAGRGVLPPGRPWAGYAMRQVSVSQSPNWSQQTVLTARKAGGDAIFGVSGFRLSAPPAGGELTLQAENGHAFRRFVVCAASGPTAGVMTLSLGGQAASVQLRAQQTGALCSSLTADAPTTAATVTAGAGVDLLSWGVFSGQPGVVVSNLGVTSSELVTMGLNGDEALSAELAAYAPDLIVLAYGTNEGFHSAFSSADTEAVLRAQIARLRRLAPGTPILLLAAPDAQSKNRASLANSDQGHRARLGADGWFSPPALEDVRVVQRRVAASEHVALWDWGVRMGGVGSARTWVSAGLMHADHVHYTPLGGQRLAERLQADLDALCKAACGKS